MPVKNLKKEDVDFGRTAQDYSRHRAGFPESFFRRLKEDGFLEGVHTVLDIGTGTGTLARGLARAGLGVTGLDPAQEILDAAFLLSREEGVDVRYIQGRAEKTNFPDNSFDLVTAGQCWHWFEQEDALTEIRRVLRPGGKLILAYFDWMSDAGPVREMYRLRTIYNPQWQPGAWPLGFYPQKPGEVSFEGWRALGSFCYQEDIPYTHEAWRGRVRASAGIGGSLSASSVTAFDAEFAEALSRKFPEDPMLIPHKIWAELWETGG